MLPREVAASALLLLVVGTAVAWTIILPMWARRFATPARRREAKRERAARGRFAPAAWMTTFGIGSFAVPLLLAIDGLLGKPGLLYARSLTFLERVALPLQVTGILFGIVALAVILVVGRFICEHIYGRATEERALLTSGPFAHVRHPFYVQFVLYPLAIVMISLNYVALAVVVYAVIDDRGPTLLTGWIREEEEEMRARYGEEYQRYAARTGRLLPKVRRRT